MLEIILLLFPACISILMHNYVFKKEHNAIEYLFLYGGYVCLVNTCSMLALYIYSNREIILSDEFYRLSFTIKYFGLNMLLAFLVPIILGFLYKNFTIKINFKKVKNEKKSTKKHS